MLGIFRPIAMVGRVAEFGPVAMVGPTGSEGLSEQPERLLPKIFRMNPKLLVTRDPKIRVIIFLVLKCVAYCFDFVSLKSIIF